MRAAQVLDPVHVGYLCFRSLYLRPGLRCGLQDTEAGTYGTEMALGHEFVLHRMSSSPRAILFIIPSLSVHSLDAVKYI